MSNVMFLKDPDCTSCLILICAKTLRHPYINSFVGRRVKVVAETETKVGPAYIFEIPEDIEIKIPEEIKIPLERGKRYYQILKKFTKPIIQL